MIFVPVTARSNRVPRRSKSRNLVAGFRVVSHNVRSVIMARGLVTSVMGGTVGRLDAVGASVLTRTGRCVVGGTLGTGARVGFAVGTTVVDGTNVIDGTFVLVGASVLNRTGRCVGGTLGTGARVGFVVGTTVVDGTNVSDGTFVLVGASVLTRTGRCVGGTLWTGARVIGIRVGSVVNDVNLVGTLVVGARVVRTGAVVGRSVVDRNAVKFHVGPT